MTRLPQAAQVTDPYAGQGVRQPGIEPAKPVTPSAPGASASAPVASAPEAASAPAPAPAKKGGGRPLPGKKK